MKKLGIFIISFLIIFSCFYFVSAQTIPGTSKWQYVNYGLIKPISNVLQVLIGGTATTTPNSALEVQGGATFDSATTTDSLRVGSFISFPEITTPPNPDADNAKLYVVDEDSDTKIKFLTSDGTEIDLTGGGGGCVTLDCLYDVLLTSEAEKDVLYYDGSQFINKQIEFSDLSNSTSSIDYWETLQWRWATSSEQNFWNTTTTWAGFKDNFDSLYNATTTLNGFDATVYLLISSFETYFDTYYNATTTLNGLTISDYLAITDFATYFANAHNATTTYPGFQTQFEQAYNATTTLNGFTPSLYLLITNFDTYWDNKYNATTTLNGLTISDYLAIADFATYFATYYNATTTQTNFLENWNTLYNATTTQAGFATQFAQYYNATTTQTNFLENWNDRYNATTTLNGFTNNQTNWNTAYGWGDHSTAGYAVKASDNIFTAINEFTNYPKAGNGVVAPTSSTQLVPKWYVDSLSASGAIWKEAVRVASTGDTATSGPQTVDGVSAVAGNRVLLKDEPEAQNNGCYVVVDPGDWTLCPDSDNDAEVNPGTAYFVSEGVTNAASAWVVITDDPITPGVTELTFSKIQAAPVYTAGDGLDLDGLEFSLDIKDNQPVYIDSTELSFRYGYGLDLDDLYQLRVATSSDWTLANLTVNGTLSGAGVTAAQQTFWNSTSTWTAYDTNWARNANATTTYPGFQTQFATAHNATTTYPGFATQFAAAYNATTTQTNFLENWNTLHNATTTYPGFATQFAQYYNATTTLNGFTPSSYLAITDFATYFATYYNATTTQTNFLDNWNTLHNATTTYPGFQTQFNTALNATTTWAAFDTNWNRNWYATTTFPNNLRIGGNATSSHFAASEICLNNDCQTSWPSGTGSSDWATSSEQYFWNTTTTWAYFDTNWNRNWYATTTFPSSLTIGGNATSTHFAASEICLANDCITTWPTGASTGEGTGLATTTNDMIIFGIPNSNATYRKWNNMPSAATEIFAATDLRRRFDTTAAREYRLKGELLIAGASTADLDLECSSDLSTWYDADTGGAGELAINSTGNIYGNFASLTSVCQGDRYWRVIGKEGNNIADPQFVSVVVELRQSISFALPFTSNWQVTSGYLAPSTTIDVVMPANATTTGSLAVLGDFTASSTSIILGNPNDNHMKIENYVIDGYSLPMISFNSPSFALPEVGAFKDGFAIFQESESDMPAISFAPADFLDTGTTGYLMYNTTTFQIIAQPNFGTDYDNYAEGNNVLDSDSLNNVIAGFNNWFVGAERNVVAAHNTQITGHNNLVGGSGTNRVILQGDNNILSGAENMLKSDDYGVYSSSNNIVSGIINEVIDGSNNLLVGSTNEIEDGESNIVGGVINYATGDASFVFGRNNTTTASDNIALGNSMIMEGTHSMGFGLASGGTVTQDNVFVIMGGQVGIATTTPWTGYELAITGDEVLSGNLYVLGNATSSHFAASEICLADDCITSWPSGGVVAWDDITDKPATSTVLSLLDSDYRISSLNATSTLFQSATTTESFYSTGLSVFATTTLRMGSSIFDSDSGFGFTFTSTDFNDPLDLGALVNQIPVLSFSNSSEVFSNNLGAINNALIITESLVGTGNEDGADLPQLIFAANDVSNILDGSLAKIVFNTTTYALDFTGASIYNFDNIIGISTTTPWAGYEFAVAGDAVITGDLEWGFATSSVNVATSTNDTSYQALRTITIPAGTFKSGDIMNYGVRFKKLGSTNSFGSQISLNGDAILTQSNTGTASPTYPDYTGTLIFGIGVGHIMDSSSGEVGWSSSSTIDYTNEDLIITIEGYGTSDTSMGLENFYFRQIK